MLENSNWGCSLENLHIKVLGWDLQHVFSKKQTTTKYPSKVVATAQVGHGAEDCLAASLSGLWHR